MTKPGDPTRPTGDDRDRALARLEKALREALERADVAESMLDDQRQRLKSLGLGREESMRQLAEARDELRRVSIERDELRKKLSRIDSMQTETIALPDDYAVPGAGGWRDAVARRAHGRARRDQGNARDARGRPSASARSEPTGRGPLRGNDVAGARVPGEVRGDRCVSRARSAGLQGPRAARPRAADQVPALQRDDDDRPRRRRRHSHRQRLPEPAARARRRRRQAASRSRTSRARTASA